MMTGPGPIPNPSKISKAEIALARGLSSSYIRALTLMTLITTVPMVLPKLEKSALLKKPIALLISG